MMSYTLKELNQRMKDYQKLLETVDTLTGIIAEKNAAIAKLQDEINHLKKAEQERDELDDILTNKYNHWANEYDKPLSEAAKKQAGLPPYEPWRTHVDECNTDCGKTHSWECP